MSEVWEVEGQLFATKALAEESICKTNPQWGRSVGYRKQTQPRRRPVHRSMDELVSWAGKGKWNT